MSAGARGGRRAPFDLKQALALESPATGGLARSTLGFDTAMRLGIFSDIHANLEALSAVLEAYRTERIDVFYCLGDTVGYGGSPNECADLVRETAKKTILGNHDAAVSGRMDYSYYYEAARHALDAHAATLTEVNMAWLKGLPYQEKLDDHDVLLCHGSPVRLEEFEYIFAPEQARECLSIWDRIGHITLIGHSHLCKVFALTPGSVEELPSTDFNLEADKKYIVSVGSVGQPRDFDNRASYTVYDTDKKRFEFKRIEYDIELAADKVLRARLERNFAHRLFIGV
jgi:predicted phosphodiesterase